jgi:succinyl-diaminopimelate desuccinylase
VARAAQGPAADRARRHTDTVPAQGNTSARLEDGRLYGLGTTDMKAGDAVMLALADALDPDALRFDLAMVFYDGKRGRTRRMA